MAMTINNCTCAKDPDFMAASQQFILSAAESLGKLFEQRNFCEEMGRHFMSHLCSLVLQGQDISNFENEIRKAHEFYRGKIN